MVTLRPMTAAEFQNYLEPAIIEYAQDHVQAGQWAEEEAVEKSRQEFQSLLPDGIATPNHSLFTLVNEAQQKVGILWFARRESQGQPAAFVYDVRIDERFQRQGYASQAFHEMEKKVRELGWNRISLHVFGNNRAALDLYKKLGYEMTNILMAKNLDPQ
ncbi:MAG TPA: GNAT family N-acetyltransferase [Ktedonobacteraceae bacterium]|nr:GNAT family N-acetyltransferase [Ktedonobacteraceae bacterium]